MLYSIATEYKPTASIPVLYVLAAQTQPDLRHLWQQCHRAPPTNLPSSSTHPIAAAHISCNATSAPVALCVGRPDIYSCMHSVHRPEIRHARQRVGLQRRRGVASSSGYPVTIWPTQTPSREEPVPGIFSTPVSMGSAQLG